MLQAEVGAGLDAGDEAFGGAVFEEDGQVALVGLQGLHEVGGALAGGGG